MYLLEVRIVFSGYSTRSLPETLGLLPVTKAVLFEVDFESLPPTLLGFIRKISLRASMVPHRCQCASEDRALQ